MTHTPKISIDSWMQLALVVVTLVKGCVWIGIFPVWKIADEPAHFDNIQYRAERMRAPRLKAELVDPVIAAGTSTELHESWDASQHYWRTRYLPGKTDVPEEAKLRSLAKFREARLSDGQTSASEYPGLYYDIGVLPYLLFQHSSIVARAFAIRCVSLGFGLVAVLCTFASARLIFDDRWMALAASVFVALQPIGSQQMAAINNDAAVIGLSALAIYLQTRILVDAPTLPSMTLSALLGSVTGLDLLCKPQALALVPGSIAALFFVAWPLRRVRATWARLAVSTGTFAAFAIPALIQLRRTSVIFNRLNRLSRPKAPPVHEWFGAWLFHDGKNTAHDLFLSWCGHFGWGEYGFSASWMAWFSVTAAIGFAALLVAIVLRYANLYAWWKWRGLALAIGTVLLMFGFVMYVEYHARAHLGVMWVAQGRNLLPAMPAIGILAAIAFGSFASTRLRPVVAAVMTTACATVNIGALLTITRYHYGN